MTTLHSMIDSTPSRADRAGLSVHAIARKERIELWLYRGDRPVRQQAALPKALVLDAGRYGQDLIEDSISALLRDIESRRVGVGPPRVTPSP